MTNVNSRAAALIDNDGWKTHSNNRKQNQRQRQIKRLNTTSQKSKNSNTSNEVKIEVDSNTEFPELGISKKQSKLEKRMNYLGVASHEITVEKEEPVKDGWLKIKQDKNGFVSKTYGKNNNSLQIEQEMENRNINEIFRNIVARHNYYKFLDQENYFTNYKFSWESDSDNESISDGFSNHGDDGDDNFADDDEEFNADY
jgi:hypothetical protein